MTSKERRVKFEALVQKAVHEQRIDRDAAVQQVYTLNPELLPPRTAEVANENDTPAARAQRARQIQKLVTEYIRDMRLDPATGYDLAFRMVLTEHPELRMHEPSRDPMWDKARSAHSKTPPTGKAYDRSQSRVEPKPEVIPGSLRANPDVAAEFAKQH